MQDLIERLEKAEKPSRGLDAEIWAIARPGRYQQKYDSVLPFLPKGTPEETRRAECLSAVRTAAPRYTASLDAALTLVPEDEVFEIMWDDDMRGRRRAYVEVGEYDAGDDCRVYRGEGPRPALAVCIAALRARGEG